MFLKFQKIFKSKKRRSSFAIRNKGKRGIDFKMENKDDMRNLVSSDGPDNSNSSIPNFTEPIKHFVSEFRSQNEKAIQKRFLEVSRHQALAGSNSMQIPNTEELNLPSSSSQNNPLQLKLPLPGISSEARNTPFNVLPNLMTNQSHSEEKEDVIDEDGDILCPDCVYESDNKLPTCHVQSCNKAALEFMFCGCCVDKLKEIFLKKYGPVAARFKEKEDVDNDIVEQMRLPIPQRKKKHSAASRYRSKKRKIGPKASIPDNSTPHMVQSGNTLQQQHHGMMSTTVSNSDLHLPHIGLTKVLEGAEEESKAAN